MSQRAELIEELRLRVNDPMWPEHAEVPKSLLSRVLHELESKAVVGEPVCHRLLRKNGYGDWVNDSKDWVDGLPPPELVRDVSKHPDLYKIEYAYAAPQPSPVDAAVERDASRLKLTRDTIDRAARFAIEPDILPPEEWEAAGLYMFAHAVSGCVGIVDDLSALVSRLARSLRRAAPDNDLPDKAMDYLRRHGLSGAILRDEALAAQQQAIEAVEPFGWFITSHNDGYGRQETFTRAPVMKALVEHSYSGTVDATPLWDHPPATQGDVIKAATGKLISQWNLWPADARRMVELIAPIFSAQAGGE